ncbi:hypothetical protein D1007_55429 [Hordeum vulgare]|nr:hypothetical protein D1007_55429 [Hordeum vulgare]
MQELAFSPRNIEGLSMPFLGLAALLLLFFASPTNSCTEQENNSLINFLDGLMPDGNGGLKGGISPSLGNLTGLLHLNLSQNSLEGSLPTVLVFSRSIIGLDVSFNHLKGQIPSSICINAPSFAMLDLSYNQFSGNISLGLGSFSMLRELKVGHNHLTRALPDGLFNATSLEHLSLANNGLQGVLDGSHIVKLSNLSVLDLGSTGLCGKIPASVSQLRRLKKLYLDNNNMSGELPSTLGNCSNLGYITLRNISFTGDLSKVNFTMLDMRTTDFSMNNFTGTIPESIYSCTNQ